MHKHVALYARVSSDRQVEEGTIDSQLASLQTYSDDHGYTIDADMIFLDDGFSGAILAPTGVGCPAGSGHEGYDRCGARADSGPLRP